MYTNDGLWGIFFAYKKGSDSFSDIDIKMLSIYVSQFSIALQNSFSYEDVSKGYFETISSLSKAVDAKDHYTRGHSENVKDYSLMIVDEMGLGNEFREKIMYAGLLHDIGKIGVRTEIIVKPDKLTNEEYEEMKKHPIYGKDILEPIEFLGDVPYYVLYHHEKLDGTGYPFGLTASEIPLGAKILQVADSYDAMTTDRSYRKRRNPKLAVEELERCSGTQFDEKIVEAFKNALKKKGKL
jgi:HD-GYP domain-containing protein (c-di-GMP phosphodiesterase class II)